jgi:heat shock protein HslJ
MRTTLTLLAVLFLALPGCAPADGGAIGRTDVPTSVPTSEPRDEEATPVTDFSGEWQLVKASDAAGPMPVNGVPVTLVVGGMVAGDADVAGRGPCNGYTGSLTIDGDSVTFGLLARTLMACADDRRNALEVRYLAALEAVTGASLTEAAPAGDTLTLTGPDATLRFTLVPKKRVN